MPRIDDVLLYFAKFLRTNSGTTFGQSYGYDIYVPNICRAFAREVENVSIQDPSALERRAIELSSIFYEAAWELCRRGIIRPGVKKYHEQSTEGCDGYSFTTIGRQWLRDTENAVFVPLEPSRVAEILNRFRSEFGEGFFQRAQEAVKCHSSNSYLASCVMCGAAAESIFLHLAIEKKGNEEEIVKIYRAANGRSKIENFILHGKTEQLQNTFRNLTELLKYWRDNASHGTASEISEFEAYEAIARLLRFAHFATDHKADLTT